MTPSPPALGPGPSGAEGWAPAPEGPVAPARSSQSASCLAVSVALAGFLVVGFFAASVGAVVLRMSRGADAGGERGAAPAGLPTESPGSFNAPRRARVAVPRVGVSGVVRATPSKDGVRVAFLPNGTTVDLGERDGDWFRVSATRDGKRITGWMHKDILERETSP